MAMIPKFVASVSSGIAPLTVTFTNTSTGQYNRVKWEFGDGQTSTEINPTHKFTNNGTFNVKLTTYDNANTSETYSYTVEVFADTNLATLESETQQTLSFFKRFTTDNVSVRATKSNGTVFSTQIPLSSETEMNMSLGAFNLTLQKSSFSSETSTTISYVDVSSTLDDLIDADGIYSANCYLLVSLNETGGTLGVGSQWHNVYSGDPGDFHQTLVYNVVGINAGDGSGTITVDRPLPYYSAAGHNNLCQGALLFTNSGTTPSANTYNSNYNRSLRSKQAIDNYDMFEVEGVSAHTEGKGFLNFYGYDEGTGQTITAMYPLYSGYDSADGWYPGSIRLHLPTVMWHKSSTPGLTLYDSADSTMRGEANELRYRYLRDGTSSTNNIVGKVYYDKKMIVLDDVEVNAALQFNSNRSYTLPPISTNYQALGTVTDFQTGTAYYVTYRVFDYDGPATAATGGFGLGHLRPLHCRYMQRVVPSVSGQSLGVILPLNYLTPWYTSDAGAGTGFTVSGTHLIIGTGSSETYVPDYSSFKYSAMGASFHTSLASTNVPDYSGAGWSTYTLTGDYLSGNSNLHFGKEILGIGYLSGNLETTIYKMAASCVAKNNEFNTTQNTTFDSSTNESVFISEIAAYNENNDLLMIGKLNTPIEKNDQKYVTIKLELDF